MPRGEVFVVPQHVREYFQNVAAPVAVVVILAAAIFVYRFVLYLHLSFKVPDYGV
jgi:hypothetical protein